jgi:hypothetical protein
MNNLTDMFGGFRREDFKNEFLAIQMEALANADQRDMNINAEKDRSNFTDATGEAIDVGANLESFDALAEEALGVDGFEEMELTTESPESFAARWGTPEGREARYAEARAQAPNKYQTMLDNQHRDAAIHAGFNGKQTPSWGSQAAAKSAAALRTGKESYEFAEEGKGKCTCGTCSECEARKAASEEWEFGNEAAGPEIEAMIDAIPESSVEECVESFNALDDELDGTSQQQMVRESLSAQLELLIPSY